MLCYMKKCPTIYIKTDMSIYQLEQRLVLKAFCKITKNVTTWLHCWLSFTLTKNAFQFKKKNYRIDYIPRKSIPLWKSQIPFTSLSTNTLLYLASLLFIQISGLPKLIRILMFDWNRSSFLILIISHSMIV